MNALHLNQKLQVIPSEVGRGFSFNQSLNKYAKLTLGMLGLTIVTPVSLTIRGYLCFKLGQLNRDFSKDVNKIYSQLPNMSDSEKIDSHLVFERVKRNILPSIEKIEKSFVNQRRYSYTGLFFNKINHHLKTFKALIIESEEKLKNAAYPEYQRRGLTEEQNDELKKYYQASGVDFSDWDDDELDVYEEHYKL